MSIHAITLVILAGSLYISFQDECRGARMTFALVPEKEYQIRDDRAGVILWYEGIIGES